MLDPHAIREYALSNYSYRFHNGLNRRFLCGLGARVLLRQYFHAARHDSL